MCNQLTNAAWKGILDTTLALCFEWHDCLPKKKISERDLKTSLHGLFCSVWNPSSMPIFLAHFEELLESAARDLHSSVKTLPWRPEFLSFHERKGSRGRSVHPLGQRPGTERALSGCWLKALCAHISATSAVSARLATQPTPAAASNANGRPVTWREPAARLWAPPLLPSAPRRGF